LKKVLKNTIKITLIFISLAGLLFLLLQNYSDNLLKFLEKSHRLDAEMLVIEAWLPDPAIEMAKSEIHNQSYDFIVTTGIKSSELDFCMVAMNGYLIFYPGLRSNEGYDSEHHKIEVVARSKMGGKYCSHFNFYINDSIIADFNADEKPGKYKVEWNAPLSEIDSLMFEFTNDYLDVKGDRNLYIKEIIFDDSLVIPYQFNSVFDIGNLGGNDRTINDYESHPEIVRNKLIKSGIDSSKVIAVTGSKTRINRTLTGALAFRDWLMESGQNVRDVNIISMGIHARRTWMTYKKVLGKSYNIGIIALPESGNEISEKSKRYAAITETLDLVYYWVILIFF
jgi:hypothetical protein